MEGYEFNAIAPPAKKRLLSRASSGTVFSMAGQGSTGNVIAALCSFFIPGLGQLIQGRLLMAIIMFVLAGVVWIVTLGTLGWLVHLWSIIDAAMFKPKG
ncbi:MAG TPA: hypothetical protein VF551_02555 [Chthoniobacterales bacterium]